jgi:hypothetical protein
MAQAPESEFEMIASLIETRFFLRGKMPSLIPIMPKSPRLLHLVAAVLVVLVLSGCSPPEIPEELKMDELRYDASTSHSVGPAGLNKGFKVYELDDDVADLVNSRGLEFLNTMPSALSYKPVKSKPGYEGSIDRYSFTEWQSLPVPQDARWNYNSSYPKFDRERPVLADYYGGHPRLVGADPASNFHEAIDPAQRERFQRVILGKGGYFSYGGFRNKELIVIDLDGNKIYHLYVR